MENIPPKTIRIVGEGMRHRPTPLMMALLAVGALPQRMEPDIIRITPRSFDKTPAALAGEERQRQAQERQGRKAMNRQRQNQLAREGKS